MNSSPALGFYKTTKGGNLVGGGLYAWREQLLYLTQTREHQRNSDSSSARDWTPKKWLSCEVVDTFTPITILPCILLPTCVHLERIMFCGCPVPETLVRTVCWKIGGTFYHCKDSPSIPLPLLATPDFVMAVKIQPLWISHAPAHISIRFGVSSIPFGFEISWRGCYLGAWWGKIYMYI